MFAMKIIHDYNMMMIRQNDNNSQVISLCPFQIYLKLRAFILKGNLIYYNEWYFLKVMITINILLFVKKITEFILYLIIYQLNLWLNLCSLLVKSICPISLKESLAINL